MGWPAWVGGHGRGGGRAGQLPPPPLLLLPNITTAAWPSNSVRYSKPPFDVLGANPAGRACCWIRTLSGITPSIRKLPASSVTVPSCWPVLSAVVRTDMPGMPGSPCSRMPLPFASW